MKFKLILMIAFLSMNALAETKIERGVIREVACNRPSGLGFLILEQKVNRKLIKNGIKVNSAQLCKSAAHESPYLVEVGYDALIQGAAKTFDIIIENGFAVDTSVVNFVNYEEFVIKVEEYVMDESLREVAIWYHTGPDSIKFHHSNEEVKSLIEKYTR